MKLLLATFFLILSLAIPHLAIAAAPYVTAPPPPYVAAPPPTATPTLSYCDMKCGERCGKAGYKDRCLKYCGICCQQCKCVPSGTYGNKSECPCYRDKKNSKGQSKCP